VEKVGNGLNLKLPQSLNHTFFIIRLSIEEMLASIGHALDPDADAMALHYRHLSISILRQLRLGRKLEDIVLDRARGHVVSKLDPVTGGVR
jgi:hypothetical protein